MLAKANHFWFQQDKGFLQLFCQEYFAEVAFFCTQIWTRAWNVCDSTNVICRSASEICDSPRLGNTCKRNVIKTITLHRSYGEMLVLLLQMQFIFVLVNFTHESLY